jgi:DNA replication protein DnaC
VEEPNKEDIRRFLKVSSLDNTFDSFDVVKGTEKTYRAMKVMAEEEHQPMLLVCGAIGNGKTHLCEALSIALYKKGIKCPVTLWGELKKRLLQRMHYPKPSQADYYTMFEELKKRKYIIIDDVGLGSSGSSWEMTELEDLINYRYRERLFTVVTTNRTLEELPERVVSRFFDVKVARIIVNEGQDYRLAKAGEKRASKKL